jgi:hypothetical protein
MVGRNLPRPEIRPYLPVVASCPAEDRYEKESACSDAPKAVVSLIKNTPNIDMAINTANHK